jgi:hypothetical protein
MAELDVTNIASASITTPSSGVTAIYVDGTNAPTKRLRTKDDVGAIIAFIGQDTTDTLTNKTLSDSTTVIGAVADTSKAVKFLNSGQTASTTLTLANTQATSQTLSFPLIREAETLAVRPQNVQFAVAAPTGTTNTTGLMMGLSNGTTRITPQVTGDVMIIITGMMSNGTIGSGASVQIRFGTGNGPANAAALTGTTVGSLKNMISSTVAGKQGFACCGFLTGAALNTALYIDVGLKAVTSGTATIFDVDVVAYEF